MRQRIRGLAAAGLALASGLLAAASALAQDGIEVYRLGPGDEIAISVFGEDDLALNVRLTEEGAITYPFLGRVAVENLTTDELAEAITSGLKPDYYVDPRVTVTITEYRPFFVNGAVRNPGAIPYQPRLTLERAIALAGGFTERASRNRIEVLRASAPGSEPVDIELFERVYAGDVITVRESFF